MCNIDCIKWAYHNLTKKEVMGKSVLEVGSYDVNGSLRYIVELMEPSEYTGVDVEEGPGVDMVCQAEGLTEKFGREKFDFVISSCVLEHLRDWKTAVSNMKNVCKPGGTLLIIVPSDWPYHAYPYDFWRYSKEDIENIFADCDFLAIEEDPKKPSNVYAKIRKPSSFMEKDLSGYKLYSMILQKKTDEIEDRDIDNFRKKYNKRVSRKKLKANVKDFLSASFLRKNR